MTVTCVNKHTQKWFIDCVEDIKEWKGIRLHVGEARLVLNTTKVITRLPPEMNNRPIEGILQNLNVQNKGIKTEDWRIINTKTESTGKTVVFLLNDDEMRKLKERSLALYLSFSKISFTILEKKPKSTADGPENSSGQHSAQEASHIPSC